MTKLAIDLPNLAKPEPSTSNEGDRNSMAQPPVGPFRSGLGPSWFSRAWLIPLMIGLAYVLVYQPIEVGLGAVAAVVAVWLLPGHPWLIWAAIAISLPVASSVSIGPAKASDILLVVALFLWVIDGARRRTLRLAFGFPALLFFLFAGYQMTLLLFTVDLGEAVTEVIKWVQIAALLMLIPAMVPDEKRPWILGALLIGGAIQGIFGLYQFLFQVGHPSFVLMDRFMRASGTFGQPNPYAGYLGTLLPVGISMTFFSRSGLLRDGVPKSTWVARVLPVELLFYAGVTALIGLGMIVSWSRGGWLGTVAAVGFILLFYSRRALAASSALGLILVLVFLLSSFDASLIPTSIQVRLGNLSSYFGVNIDQVLNQTVNDDNFAIIERMAHWKAALLMWQQDPWTGVGPGGYANAYPAIIETDPRLLLWEDPLGHAHNIYLNFLAEMGLPGLGVYLSLIAGLFVWIWRQIRAQIDPNSYQRALAIGVMGVLTYLAVHNGFDNMYVQGIYLHLGFWLALLVNRP